MMEPADKLTVSFIAKKVNNKVDDLKTIGDCIKYYAGKLKDREAFVFASRSGETDRQSVSWEELYEKSLTVARSLVIQGVKPREFVAINIRPCPEWLYLAFGVMFAGARIAPISFTYTDGSDLIALMNKLETCSMLAFDPGDDCENLRIVKQFVQHFRNDGSAKSSHIPSLRYLLGHGISEQTSGIKTIGSLLSEDVKEVKLPTLHPEEIFVVFQTSGSTGIPKVVAHTHFSFMILRKLIPNLDKIDENSSFNDRPFNWMGGFPNTVIYGQKRVTVSGFGEPAADELGRVFEIIRQEKCNFAVSLPSRISEMIKRKSELPSDWPLVLLMSGGQPIARQHVSAIGSICKMMLVSYGSTEMLTIANCILMNPDLYKDNYCGTVPSGIGTEVKVVDDKGEILPINTAGEIYVKSPGLFKEYYNDPEKSSAVFTPDGWFKTDDIGRITENSELYVEGRKSNIILSGGMNVSPELVENILKTCAGVEAVVVVPISDPTYYQVLCACVTKKKGNDLTGDQLRQFCESRHNDKPGIFTVLPKFYLFLDSFPETTSGKYARKELEKIAKRHFQK